MPKKKTSVKTKRLQKPASPLDALLGRAGEPVMCKEWAPDISIHWFASFDKGTKCVCGKTERTGELNKTRKVKS